MRARFYILTLIAAAGALVSDYLVRIHAQTIFAKAGDTGLCAAAAGFSCAEAARSVYSTVMGLPVAVLNEAFFLTLIALVGIERTWPLKFPRIPDALFASTLLAVLVSLFMAGVSAFVIDFWCPWCMVLYALNAGAFATVAATHPDGFKRAFGRMFTLPANPAFWVSVGIMGLITVFGQGVYVKRAEAAHDAYRARQAAMGMQAPAHYDLAVGDAPGRGPADAPVVIVEFSDFECPYCKRFTAELKAAAEKAGGDLRYHFKHFPMDNACNPLITREFHKNACDAAAATVCAQRQGKFWEMHDLLFENNRRLAPEHLVDYAAQLGLDVETFRACLEDPEVIARIREDIAQGEKVGVQGTPTFYVNGWRHEGGRSADELVGLIREAKRQKERGGEPPQ